MDRERTEAGFSQASRPKRLRFHGNQYTVEEEVDNPRHYYEISTLLFRVLLILLLLFFFYFHQTIG